MHRAPDRRGRRPGLPPDVSIVIAALDAEATLGAQLDALAAQRAALSFEVVLADNGSNDGTVALALAHADRFDALTVVDASQRGGAAAARNVALDHVRADKVLFCDADDVVGPGWVEAMADALDSTDVAASLLHWFGGPTPSTGLEAAPEVPTNDGVLYAPGGGCGLTRHALETLHGFDEGVWSEDTELSFRARAKGLTLTLVPSAVVYVRQRASLLAMWRQHFAWGRADPYLWGRYGDVLPRRSQRDALIVWYCVVTRFPIVRTSAGRREWVRLASYRFGRLVGSVEHRHLVLGWAVAAGAALTVDVAVTSVT